MLTVIPVTPLQRLMIEELLPEAAPGKVFAVIHREQFDAAKGNAKTSGRLIITARALRPELCEKVRKVIAADDEKERAKFNARMGGGNGRPARVAQRQRMNDAALLEKLEDEAASYVLGLDENAREDGPTRLLLDGRAKVWVKGLKCGRVEIDGQPATLLDLTAAVMNLSPENARDYAEFALETETTEGPETRAEPPPETREEHEHVEFESDRQIVPRAASDLPQREVVLRAKPESKGSHLPDIHRLLPQSTDAEQGVLSSILLAPKAVLGMCAAKGVFDDYFHIPAHRTIYNTLRWMDDERLEIDVITLTQHLRDQRLLDKVGGPAFITDLFTFMPTAANAGYYIEILEEKFTLREVIRVCTEYAARSYDEQGEVTALVDQVELKVRAISERRIYKSQRLPGLRDLSKMLGANKPVRPPELVKGLLHQGSKIIIGGTSKGRKTFSLLDLAISVATGTPWWQFDCVKGRVCYINFEIQEPFFADRTEDICRAKEVSLPAGALMCWMLRGHSEGIEKMVAQLMSVLMQENFALIIFDPIYKALGNRDENKAGDVASLCNELERIAVRTGAAIAFGAHYSKGNQSAKDSIDRIGGSGVFARDPDAILTMTAHEQEECFTVEATLRNFPPLAPFVVKWEWPLFRRDGEADPAALKQVPTGNRSGTYKAEFTSEMLTEQLSVLDGVKPGVLRRQMDEAYGMSKPTFYRLLGGLKKDKKAREHNGLLFRMPGTP